MGSIHASSLHVEVPWFVRLFVSVLVTIVSPAKTAQPIEMTLEDRLDWAEEPCMVNAMDRFVRGLRCGLSLPLL